MIEDTTQSTKTAALRKTLTDHFGKLFKDLLLRQNDEKATSLSAYAF